MQADTLDAIMTDLAERDRLDEMKKLFTFAAIGRRYGVSKNTIWYYQEKRRVTLAQALARRGNGTEIPL